MSEGEPVARKGFGARIGAELYSFKAGLTLSGGDVGSLFQLFFDNLSTLLGALFAVQALTTFGDIAVSQDVMNEYVWGKIVPGVGITLVVGNIYYSWQAIRYVLVGMTGIRVLDSQSHRLSHGISVVFLFLLVTVSRIITDASTPLSRTDSTRPQLSHLCLTSSTLSSLAVAAAMKVSSRDTVSHWLPTSSPVRSTGSLWMDGRMVHFIPMSLSSTAHQLS
jgi:hypothetical protein